MIPLRNAILKEALRIAPKTGFTEGTLFLACESAKTSPGALAILFPDGPVHLVHHIIREANVTSLQKLRESIKHGVFDSSYEVLEYGLLERFGYIFPYSQYWNQAMMLLANQSKIKAMLELGLYVDELNHHLEKFSMKSSLVKNVQRCTLAGICLSTELHLISDRSPEKTETQALIRHLITKVS